MDRGVTAIAVRHLGVGHQSVVVIHADGDCRHVVSRPLPVSDDVRLLDDDRTDVDQLLRSDDGRDGGGVRRDEGANREASGQIECDRHAAHCSRIDIDTPLIFSRGLPLP